MDPTTLLTPSDTTLLQPVLHRLARSRKMVFLTGAGISCNAGIPDFRSSNGLYNMTQQTGSSARGKELFDIAAFSSPESIRNFAVFMSNLYRETKKASPTPTHRYIARKTRENRVLRCYTQNIDGLEVQCGLNMQWNDDREDMTPLQRWKQLEVVQLHGDIHKLSCTTCTRTVPWCTDFFKELQEGELPECPYCIETVNKRVEAGKRTTGQVGQLRPAIVLYGENHPMSEAITTGLNSDLRARPDCLLIMGTSLKVHGVKKLVKSMAQVVHSKGGIVVLVNKDHIKGWDGIIDTQVLSDTDSFIEQLCNYEISPMKKNKMSISTILQTPPSTPKKVRVRDMLNTPTPSPKRKRIPIFTDKEDEPKTPTKKKRHSQTLPTPDQDPELFKTPKKLQRLDPNVVDQRRRSPRINKIHTLLNV